VELLQVVSTHLSLTGTFWSWIDGLDFEVLGYVIVGTFVVLWIGSVLYYKLSGVEERYGGHGGTDGLAVEVACE
jgi:nickel/cobalt transporter (NiCoT) family protein